ncbi:uncharacterized protein LOC134609434 [Pelobates fuscus]|uniref:uncharacterized protein LOC134609434 n=1 Tax=Pelobates fuscus TaxID=191477 RepID=UPI002FE4E7A3
MYGRERHPGFSNGAVFIQGYLDELRTERHRLKLCLDDGPKTPSYLRPQLSSARIVPADPSLTSEKIWPRPPSRKRKSSRREMVITIDKTKEQIERERRIHKLNVDDMSDKLQVTIQLINGVTRMENKDLNTTKRLDQTYVRELMRDDPFEKKLSCSEQSKNNQKEHFPSLVNCDSSADFTKTSVSTNKIQGFRNGLGQPSESVMSFDLDSWAAKPKKKEMFLEDDDPPPWFFCLKEKYLKTVKKPSTLNDRRAVFDEQKSNFAKLQRRLAKRTQMKILDKKSTQSTRKDQFREVLNERTGDRLQSILTEMRKIGKSLEAPEYPTEWYDDLEDECEEKFGKTGIPENIAQLMKTLSSFRKLDFFTIPFIKGKLCLLTVSLPVFTLYKPAAQKALEFILGNILQQPVGDIRCWYAYRKIPSVALS